MSSPIPAAAASAAGPAFQAATPASGDTVAVDAGSRWLTLEPAAILAACTIQLPERPSDGALVVITTTHDINALTFETLDGSALTRPPPNLPAADPALIARYDAPDNAWTFSFFTPGDF